MYQPTNRKWANVDGKILNASKNRLLPAHEEDDY